MSDSSDRHLARTGPVSTGHGRQILRFSALAPGAIFAARYRIEERIGAGGAGEVYRVHDRVAGADLALKVLFPRGSDGADPLTRLRRELRIIRDLQHPGILRTHDVGEHEGLLYLVMDLLRGESLRARIEREGKISVKETLRIAEGLFGALARAHAQGVIHRDVKPGNIFLALPDRTAQDGAVGAAERVVLLDFGLARETGDLSLTATGQFMGTPEYVSPEQARGEHRVTTATDVYSAGIVIWEMLAGSTPFAADSAPRVLAAHISKTLPHLTMSRGELPEWLRDLLSWMLEKKVRDRPADGSVVLERLSARSGRTFQARIRHAGRSAWLRFAALASVAIVVLLFVLFFPWSAGVDGQNHLVARSLARVKLREWAFEGSRVAVAVPRAGKAIWSRSYLVGLAGGKVRGLFPEAYPAGLAEVDLLGGRAESRLPGGPSVWEHGRIHKFEGYDQAMSVNSLQRLTWPSARKSTMWIAKYDHQGHYPCIVCVFRIPGKLCVRLSHPGMLRVDYLALDSPRTKDAPLLVFHGVNNELGSREVVLGFVPGPILGGTISVPPFMDRRVQTLPAFYTPVSRDSEGASLKVIDGEGVLEYSKRRSFRFDLETGVPLEAEDRDQLSKGDWLRHQRTLLNDLVNVAEDSTGLSSAAGASLLEDFANRESLAKMQAGIALSRAAELWMRAGRFRHALELINRAIEQEPLIYGHRVLKICVLTREANWEELQSALLDLPPEVRSIGSIDRHLAFAALILDHEEWIAQRLLRLNHPARDALLNSYGVQVAMLLALDRGEPQDALAALDRGRPVLLRFPEFAFLEALALATLDQPRPREALALLDAHEAGFGGGPFVPELPLRAYLATLGAGAAPTARELEAALETQRLEARTNLSSWYFLPWAEFLAARAYGETGDTSREAELITRAKGRRPAGRWLERLDAASR